MKLRPLLLAVTLTFAAYSVKAGSFTTGPGCCKNDLSGGVVLQAQTKKPLNKVVVTVYSAAKKEKVVVTDDKGNYSLNDLRPGMYRLVFEKSGFKKVTKERVVVKQEEISQLNIEMTENDDFRIFPGQVFFPDN
jgi:Carboxypeptidase regulatory-like domain